MDLSKDLIMTIPPGINGLIFQRNVLKFEVVFSAKEGYRHLICVDTVCKDSVRGGENDTSQATDVAYGNNIYMYSYTILYVAQI